MSGSVTIFLSGLVLAGTMGIAAAADTGAGSSQGTTQADPRFTRSGDDYTDALNLLAANDYFDVTDLRQQGTGFIARAVHDGRLISVFVDLASGRVLPQG